MADRPATKADLDDLAEKIDQRFDLLETQMKEGFDRVTGEFKDVKRVTDDHESRIHELETAA